MYVIVNRFSEMEHFIPCHKTDGVSYIAHLFFMEILRLHGMHKSIISYRYANLLRYFWATVGKGRY